MPGLPTHLVQEIDVGTVSLDQWELRPSGFATSLIKMYASIDNFRPVFTQVHRSEPSIAEADTFVRGLI